MNGLDPVLDEIFLRNQPKEFLREMNPLQVHRIRAGFNTSTPLQPRGVKLDRLPAGPRDAATIDRNAADLEKRFEDDGDGSDGFDRNRQAEIDYQGVCEDGTGRFVPEQAFEALRERRERLDAQTLELADDLGCRGEAFNYGPNHEGRVSIIGAFTGCVLPLPSVRRVAFLPSIAAAQRSKMLRDVEWFLLQHPTACRMFTITNGKRVLFESPEQFRKAQGAFGRRISKLQTEAPFRRYLVPRKHRKRAGKRGFKQVVQIEWRAIEYGTPEFDLGRLSLHLHAHLLVRELVPMTGKARAKFRRKLWRLLGRDQSDAGSVGRHWDDAGRIQNPREFVKYPAKPADLEMIRREGGPGLLRDFYEAVRGMHIVQPMGELRRERSARKALGKRIYSVQGPDGRQLVERYDPNAGKRPLAKPNAIRKAYRDAAWLAEWTAKSRALPQHVMGRLADEQAETERLAAVDEGNQRPETPVSDRATPRIANRIIARLAPAPYGGTICEPAFVVWGFDGNHLAVYQQPLAARVRALHAPAYAAARDARALAHACAPAPRASDQGSQRSNNCPHADSGPRPRKRPDAWANVGWTELLALN